MHDSSDRPIETVDGGILPFQDSAPISRKPRATRHLVIGAGQIGKALESELAELRYPVRMLTRAEFDLERPAALESVFGGEEFDYVWLTAAETRVDWCEDNAEYTAKVNAFAPGVIAKICAKYGAKLFFFSTDYVFSGMEGAEIRGVPYLESSRPSPVSVYGEAKLKGESAVLGAGMGFTVVRTSGVFVAGGRNFFESVANKAKSGGDLKIVGDQVISPTNAIHLASWLAARYRELPGGIVHLAAAGGCSWFEAARAALGFIGIKGANLLETTSAELGRKAKRPAYSVLGSEVLPKCGLPGLPSWLEGVAAWASAVAETDGDEQRE